MRLSLSTVRLAALSVLTLAFAAGAGPSLAAAQDIDVAPMSAAVDVTQEQGTVDLAPSQIAAIAVVCHEANRAYCAGIGDHSQPAWADAPDWQRESAIDGVQKILSGEVTRPEQSHESWFAHKRADGWVYGEVKDPDRKQHPCMVPFADLPAEQQRKDKLFFGIVQALTS